MAWGIDATVGRWPVRSADRALAQSTAIDAQYCRNGFTAGAHPVIEGVCVVSTQTQVRM
jgi:hypothetical protein